MTQNLPRNGELIFRDTLSYAGSISKVSRKPTQRYIVIDGITYHKYTSTSLSEAFTKLKELALTLGRAPTKEELGRGSWLLRTSYGSWTDALLAAGITPNPKKYYPRHDIKSDLELLNDLRQFYALNGRSPQLKEFSSLNSLQCRKVYSARFGNVAKALRRAGLPVKTLSEKNATNARRGLPPHSTVCTSINCKQLSRVRGLCIKHYMLDYRQKKPNHLATEPGV